MAQNPTLAMPQLEEKCPSCEGSGDDYGLPCFTCEGVGYRPTEAGQMVLRLIGHSRQRRAQPSESGG